MKRFLAVLLTALALAAPATAAPLPIAVVTIQAPGVAFGSAELVDALVYRLSNDGLIDSRRPELAIKKLKACGRVPDRVGCARQRIRKRDAMALPLHIAVIVSPGPDAQVRLQCVGPKWRTPLHPHAEAYVDLAAAFAETPNGAAWRQRLADCLDSAAADRRL